MSWFIVLFLAFLLLAGSSLGAMTPALLAQSSDAHSCEGCCLPDTDDCDSFWEACERICASAVVPEATGQSGAVLAVLRFAYQPRQQIGLVKGFEPPPPRWLGIQPSL